MTDFVNNIRTDNSGAFIFTSDTTVCFYKKGYSLELKDFKTIHIGDTIALSPYANGYEISSDGYAVGGFYTITNYPESEPDTIENILDPGALIYETVIHTNDSLSLRKLRTGFVYIDNKKDKNRTAKELETVLSFDSGYEEDLLPLIKKAEKEKNTIPSGLPREWIPLYLYNGEYYVYSPCQNINMRYKFYNASLLHPMGHDLPYFVDIKVKTIRSNEYSIRGKSEIGGNQDLNIYIIDPKRGIAVFEETNDDDLPTLQLMLDARKAKEFPLIIHECEYMLNHEFEFDEPDFPALLSKFRNK